MNHQVQIYELDRHAPGATPRASTSFVVVSDTREEARRAALAQLEKEGHTLRVLSFLAEGGLAAVVTQPPARPSPANLLRTGRGG